MDDSAVVVFSGGQDSTTCLFWALERFKEVHAVTFDYGQRHNREITAATRITRYAGVSHEIVKLGPPRVLQGTSPLVSGNELEQYEDYQSLPGGLEKTFVPMRNQLFLTIAANRAYVLGTNVIITGVSAEDYGGYPDCRPEFIESFIRTSSLGTFTGKDGVPESLRVRTPLMHLDKQATVELAVQLQEASNGRGCYQALALSHTSYDGEYPPTGKDHATLLRAKGFVLADVPDPLILRAYMDGVLDRLPPSGNYRSDLLPRFLDYVLEVNRWLGRQEMRRA